MAMYAHENRGAYGGGLGYYDDNINWMYRDYTKSPKMFVCPATRNSVRADVSTVNAAGERELEDLKKFR